MYKTFYKQDNSESKDAVTMDFLFVIKLVSLLVLVNAQNIIRDQPQLCVYIFVNLNYNMIYYTIYAICVEVCLVQ